MTPEQFRQHGHEVVDWIADYWSRISAFPVRSQVSPGEVRAALPPQAPEQGEPFSAVLADLDRVVLPGTTHWQHPGFFGYFPANTSGPSVLGDLVSAGLGVQGMSWVTSPAATELEQHLMDWFADLLGLPAAFRSTGAGGGVVQDSSSGANLVALLAHVDKNLVLDDTNYVALRAYTEASGKRVSFNEMSRLTGIVPVKDALIPVLVSFADPASPGTAQQVAPEDPAAVVVGELHAAHARRLALGHAGDRRRDRERDAAGGAAGAAIHGPAILAC